MPAVTIDLDGVDESLLGALAAARGQTVEEAIGEIVSEWLTQRAIQDAEQLLCGEHAASGEQ